MEAARLSADAEASKLIEPGKRPLHHPAPPAEATRVLVRCFATSGRIRRPRNPWRIAAAS